MIKLNPSEESFFCDVIYETLQLNDYDLQCFLACKELAELIQVIPKAQRLANLNGEAIEPAVADYYKFIENDLTGEIADVYIMLEQLLRIFDISDNQVKAKITEKLQRQAERNEKAGSENGNNF